MTTEEILGIGIEQVNISSSQALILIFNLNYDTEYLSYRN